MVALSGCLSGLYCMSLMNGRYLSAFLGPNDLEYSEEASKGMFLFSFFTLGTIFSLICGFWPG